MSDRWCDDCAWPYECMVAHACRRAEAGERRIAAPAEVADLIAAELAEAEVISEGGPASMGRRSPVTDAVRNVVNRAFREEAAKIDERFREALTITGTGRLTPEEVEIFRAWVTGS